MDELSKLRRTVVALRMENKRLREMLPTMCEDCAFKKSTEGFEYCRLTGRTIISGDYCSRGTGHKT